MTDDSTASSDNGSGSSGGSGGRFSGFWETVKEKSEPTYWWNNHLRKGKEPLKPEEVQLWHKLAFGGFVITGCGLVVACPLAPGAISIVASGYSVGQYLLFGDKYFIAVHDSLPAAFKYVNTGVAFGLVAVSLGKAGLHARSIVTVGEDGLRVVRAGAGAKCGWYAFVSAMRAKTAVKKAKAL